MTLTGFDIGMIAVYGAVILCVGMWPTRLNRTGSFLISDRRLGGTSSGVTIAASKIGAGAIVTYAALIFTFGSQALWMYAGYLVGYVVFYFFASRIHQESREREYYTIADYFRAHSGGAAAVAIGILTTVSLFGWVLTNFIAGGKLLAHATGLPFSATAPAIAGVILVYLLTGGFNAVVRTDIIQYLSLLVVLVILTVVATRMPEASSTHEFERMPVGQIIGLFVMGLFFPMGSAELWQRVYATRDKRSLRRAIGFASASFIVLGGTLSIIFVKLAQHGTPSEGVSQDIAVFDVVGARLGVGVVGIWFIALISAIASSADTFVFTTSASGVLDVAERAVGIVKEKRVSRIRIALVVCTLAGVALTLTIRDVVDVTFLFAGMTMGLGAVAIIGWIFPKMPSWVVVAACVAGNSASIAQAVTKGISVMTAVINLGLSLVVATVCTAAVVCTKKIRKRAPSSGC